MIQQNKQNETLFKCHAFIFYKALLMRRYHVLHFRSEGSSQSGLFLWYSLFIDESSDQCVGLKPHLRGPGKGSLVSYIPLDILKSIPYH